MAGAQGLPAVARGRSSNSIRTAAAGAFLRFVLLRSRGGGDGWRRAGCTVGGAAGRVWAARAVARAVGRGVARAVERGRVRVLKACTDVLCQQRPPRKRNRR